MMQAFHNHLARPRREAAVRRGRRPLAGRSLLWCFVVLLLSAVGARAQGVPEAGRGDRRSGPPEILLLPVLWQQGGPPGPPPGVAPRRGPRNRPGPPPALLQRLKNLTPEQRERVLENNRRFQQLPPERQDQLRNRLRQLQELTPEQREMIEQRFAIFNNLTAKQQEKAREIYEDRWRELPLDRRRALLQEFRHLRRMEPGKRRQRLESQELQDQFNQQERDVLAQLMAL